jgi:hypothetical protein
MLVDECSCHLFGKIMRGYYEMCCIVQAHVKATIPIRGLVGMIDHVTLKALQELKASSVRGHPSIRGRP